MTAEHIALDFRQKYADTFVLVEFNGKKIPIYINALEFDEQKPKDTSFPIRYTYCDELHDMSVTSVTSRFCDLTFDFRLPPPRFTNMGHTAVYYHRKADRQWKRGLSQHTYDAYGLGGQFLKGLSPFIEKGKKLLPPPTSKGWMNILGGGSYFGMIPIWHYFHPQYPSYQEAFHLLYTKQKFAVALDEKFAISCSETTPNFSLIREVLEVATIDKKDSKTIKVISPIFFQEVKDFFSRKGLKNVITQA